MKLPRLIYATAFCLAAFIPNSWATVVPPGTTSVPIATADLPAGSFLAMLASPVVAPTFSGIARTAVFQDTATGFLSFLFQFTSSSLSAENIERISGTPFNGFITDVFQSATAGTLGFFETGTRAASTADRGTTGDVVGFNFGVGDRITPGDTSFILQVRTNATNYKTGFMGIIDGSAGNALAFAPTAPIPEPQTYAMMLAGLGLMGFMIRRRRADR